jgi:ABC-2 type transport system permease protein
VRATTHRSGPRQKVLAITRRDLAIQLSYHFALLARIGALAVTIVTFFFIGRIVDPNRLGAYGDRYFEFVLVGLLVSGIASVGLGSFTTTIQLEQSNGTLEALLATPTGLPTLFVGALIVPAILTTIEILTVLAVATILGASFVTSGLLVVVVTVPPTLAVFAAFGGISGAFIILSKRGDPVTPLVIQFTNLLAGALFPIAVLPEALQVIAKLLPPYYALQVLRGGLLEGKSISEMRGDYAILLGFAIVLLPLSLLLLKKAFRAARVMGTLGSY